MRRGLALAVVILVLAAGAAFAQRTGVYMLNGSTDITTADPNAILVGQGDGTWKEAPLPTNCPTPGTLQFSGGAFACGSRGGGYLTTGRPLLAGSITMDVYFTLDSTSATEADMRMLAPVAGTCDTFCCQCDSAPGGSGRTFAFRVNGATTTLGVSYSASDAGLRCDTATDTATLAAGDLYDFLSTNPAVSTDMRCSCSCRLKLS